MRFLANRFLRARCGLPYVLVLVLTWTLASAQTPPAQVQAQQDVGPATVQTFKVVPLAGEGSTNDLEHKIMAPLVVQVLDQESNPIEGAQVVFRFPLNGPGATFPNGQLSQTTRSNADGQAAATGWIANTSVGTFQVHVTATRANEFGQAVISMTNATKIVAAGPVKSKSIWSSKWTKIAIVAGAAAVAAGVVLATRGGNSSTGATPTITVTATPGIPTIGAP